LLHLRSFLTHPLRRLLSCLAFRVGEPDGREPLSATANSDWGWDSSIACSHPTPTLRVWGGDSHSQAKLIDLVAIGKQLLITRGALTTFSIANDIAKYFAIIPTIFAAAGIGSLNIMGLKSPQSAILSALIYNAAIIPALIPLALSGVKFRPLTADQLLQRNILIYGLGGVITPFIAIKIIDVLIPIS
jgi:hypothetical protein